MAVYFYLLTNKKVTTFYYLKPKKTRLTALPEGAETADNHRSLSRNISTIQTVFQLPN
jgi:hypothetical protein